jgi:hypothetical protein
MIPLNIVIDGIAINEVGMPIKYIPLGVYAGKILDYLHQVDLKAGKRYDVMYINKKTTYVFTGDMYTNIWPLKKVAKLKHLALVAQTYGSPRNPVMENTVMGNGIISPTHAKRTFTVLGNNNIPTTAKALAKELRRARRSMKVRRLHARGGTRIRSTISRIVKPNHGDIKSAVPENSNTEYSTNENETNEN